MYLSRIGIKVFIYLIIKKVFYQRHQFRELFCCLKKNGMQKELSKEAQKAQLRSVKRSLIKRMNDFFS
jgi:hypothetical protein